MTHHRGIVFSWLVIMVALPSVKWVNISYKVFIKKKGFNLKLNSVAAVFRFLDAIPATLRLLRDHELTE